MRLLLVSNLYPPNSVGGYEKLAFSVASELADRGHEICILTSDYGEAVADYPGQTVLRELKLRTGATIYDPFPGDERASKSLREHNADRLRQTVARERPDLVFSWNLFFLDPSMLATLESLPVPVAVMLTDNWLINMVKPEWWQSYFAREVIGEVSTPRPTEAAPALPSRIRAFLRRLRGSGIRSGPDPVEPQPRSLTAVFGSHYMQDLHRKANLAFVREEVIHNGVRSLGAGAQAMPDRGRLVDPNGTVRLLFAGRLVDLKGAHRAVEALAILRRTRPDLPPVTLTLLGDRQDRSYERTLMAAIEASGCSAQIEIRPPVKEAELPAVFAGHDIYLFPSLYEPFSLTLIHALDAGIPTIASDAGGNPEIVVHGRTGLTYPRGDAQALADRIATLVEDPALRSRLADAGRIEASRFTFTTMVDGMERLLEGIR